MKPRGLEMSDRDPLVEVLRGVLVAKHYGIPDKTRIARELAAAARAVVAECVTREKIARVLYERIPLRVSGLTRSLTWDEYVDVRGGERERNQADAILALLRREMGGA